MKSSKALLGVLAGIATGAVLGVLFAPDKGANTRKNISKKGEGLANTLNARIDEKFDDLMCAVNGKGKKFRTQNGESSSIKSELVG